MQATTRDGRFDRLQTFLQAALGPHVHVACSDTLGDPARLWPQERLAIGSAIERRQREFAAGRAAARKALHNLGLGGCAIPAREDRSPQWPPGVVGSISHADGICVVVVSTKSACRSLGVDVEPDLAVDAELWPSIGTRRETDRIGKAAQDHQPFLATRLFTAKEAFYKWQFQITRVLLDFHEVEVEPAENDRFEIVPVSARARAVLRQNARGLWLHGDGLTFACVGHDLPGVGRRHRLAASESTLTC